MWSYHLWLIPINLISCRLLSAMPAKSSPLDALPCPLLKVSSAVFAPVIARLANLSFQTGTFPSCFKRAQVLPLLKKAGLDISSPGNYDQFPICRPFPRFWRGWCWRDCGLTCSALPTSVSTSRRRDRALDGNCTTGSPWRRLHCSWRQTDLRADRPRSVCGVWHCRPLATARTPAFRVRSNRHVT